MSVLFVQQISIHHSRSDVDEKSLRAALIDTLRANRDCVEAAVAKMRARRSARSDSSAESFSRRRL